MPHTIAYTIKPGQPDVEPEVNGFKDVITSVHWSMVGVSSDGFEASSNSSTPLPAPTEDQAFTAIKDLTADTIVAWIEANTDADYLESRKPLIAEAIEKLRNPYTPPKAPWIEEAAPADDKA